MIHSSKVRVPFPCGEAVWGAATVQQWSFARHNERPQPSFRTALRNLASHGILEEDTPAFTLWILLHGLVSVSCVLPLSSLPRRAPIANASLV
jgi:hypothetical protein